jgi:hypothetical protein
MSEDAASESAQSLSDKAFEIATRRQEAAVEVLALLDKKLDKAIGEHPETALHAAAWLAGTSLYRSFGYTNEPAPGTIMLSEVANQEWPKLMKVFLSLIEKDGIKLEPDDLLLEFSAEQRPKKSILEIQQEFQDEYNEIMRKHGFDYAEGGKAGAVVCAMLVKAYCIRRKDLDPALAAGVVEMGFIEGAKTVPAPLKPRS